MEEEEVVHTPPLTSPQRCLVVEEEVVHTPPLTSALSGGGGAGGAYTTLHLTSALCLEEEEEEEVRTPPLTSALSGGGGGGGGGAGRTSEKTFTVNSICLPNGFLQRAAWLLLLCAGAEERDMSSKRWSDEGDMSS